MTDALYQELILDHNRKPKNYRVMEHADREVVGNNPLCGDQLTLWVKLDGEKILGADCVIGYLHRGVEKIAEHRTYTQFAPYVDRMDYVAAVSNGLGYCEAVEKLLNVEAPPRARYVRTILTELNRIASHLLWLGTHALDIGAICAWHDQVHGPGVVRRKDRRCPRGHVFAGVHRL